MMFKENAIVLFMEDDFINRDALILSKRGRAPPGALPAGLAVTCAILRHCINMASAAL